jgi:hypothetical protein
MLESAPISDYAAWSTNFPGANLADPNADPDGDGVSNDAERLFGLDPTNRASSRPLSADAGLGGGAFTYTRRTPALTGYEYKVLTSTDLVVWTEDAAALQTPGLATANVEAVFITLSPAQTNHPQLFMGIRASR